MLDTHFSPAIEKLNDTVKTAFGVSIQFISSSSRAPQDIVFFETVRRNASAPLIVTHSNMLLPVRIEGILMGAIRVFDIQNLKPSEISQIKNSVENLLAETTELIEKSDLLFNSEEFDSNVLPLRKPFNEKLATAN